MEVHGMPEQFWVVTKPSPVSEPEDICFACTFGGLMNQFRGGLHEDEIVAIHADEGEARQAALRLLGKHPVRPQDAVFAEVVVHVMAEPIAEEADCQGTGRGSRGSGAERSPTRRGKWSRVSAERPGSPGHEPGGGG